MATDFAHTPASHRQRSDGQRDRMQYDRYGNHTYNYKVMALQLSDKVLDTVSFIAGERNISIYRLLREFIYDGIRAFYEDRQIAERDEDTPPQDVFANAQERNP